MSILYSKYTVLCGENMENEHLDRVIKLMLPTPSVINRKLHRKLLSEALEKVGFDFAFHHLMIMKLLEEAGTMCSTEIGEIICIAKAQITHSIDKLSSLGLVERQADVKDRRKINIRLTQRGKHTLEKMDEAIKSGIKAKLSILNEDELVKLADAFQYIADTFSKFQ